MDIDITDLKSREIVKLLTLYPQGHLEIKFERVFWCSDYSEPNLPTSPTEAYGPMTMRPPKASGASAPFERMADTLGGLVCLPSRR